MQRYLATFMLAFALIFGVAIPAHASSETESSTSSFSWSAVFSKAIFGTLVAAPAIVYFSLNNRKDD